MRRITMRGSNWTTTCLSQGAPGGVGCPINLARNAALFPLSNPAGLSSATLRPSVYLGYNWQIGNWVVGAEGDIAWGKSSNDIKGIPGAENLALIGSPGADTATISGTWDGSLRARRPPRRSERSPLRDRRCVLDPHGGERLLRQHPSDRLVRRAGRARLQSGD